MDLVDFCEIVPDRPSAEHVDLLKENTCWVIWYHILHLHVCRSKMLKLRVVVALIERHGCILIKKHMIYKGKFDRVSIAVQAYPVFKPSHFADQVMKCSVNFY